MKSTKKSGIHFSYGNNISNTKTVILQKHTQSIKAHLDELFAGSDIEYIVRKDKILLRVNGKTKANRDEIFTLSGYIREAASGEALNSASVFFDELSTGTSSNTYGFYSVSVPAGSYTLVVSYVGYEGVRQTITLTRNQKFDIELKPVTYGALFHQFAK